MRIYVYLEHFPHNQLVFYRIRLTKESQKNKTIIVKTCTLLHLTKYSFFANTSISSHLLNNFLYEANLTEKCNLDFLLSQCNLTKYEPINVINIDGFHYFLEWFEFIGPIITFPIVSFFGILTNVLVVVTIKAKKNNKIINENENSTRMFNYLAANSVFNIIECMICPFTLINECLGLGSVYCSNCISGYCVEDK